MATLTTEYQLLGQTLLGTSGGSLYIRIYAKYTSQDIANNRSYVTYQSRLYYSGGYIISQGQTKVTTSGTGATSTTTGWQNFEGSTSGYFYGGETVVKTISGTVQHNDSTGAASISASAAFSSAGSWGWSGTASGTADLPTIPRASEISSVSTANIGSNATITVNRKNSSFTHTITYSFGSLSGTVVTKSSNTSISWTIPSSFYAQIPNSKTGNGTLSITTYSGNTQIGSTSTKTFSVTTSESACKPTVTGSVVDSNNTTIAITGNNKILIAGYSTASVSYTATPKNSASIKTVTVNGLSAYSGTSASAVSGTKAITNFNANKIEIVAKDSRTYSDTKTLTAGTTAYTLVNYIPLTFSGSVSRQTPTGDVLLLSFSGKYFNGNLGATTNTLTISWKWRIKGNTSWTNGGTLVKGTDYTINTSNNTYSGSNINLGNDFDYRNNYEIGVFYNDALVNTSVVLEGKKGTPIVNWGEDYFNVNGHAIVNDIKCRNLLTITETTATSRGITASVSDGVITISGTFSETETGFRIAANASLKGGTTYTLSTNNSAGSRYPYLLLFDKDGNQIARLADSSGILTFTPSSDVEVNEIELYINSSSGVGITVKPQLEEGTSKTDFIVGKNYDFTSGSNENGNYIKYSDGTMICYKTVGFGSLAFSNAWGSLYETNRQSLGNFPVPFVGSVPNIYIMPHGAYFVEKVDAPTFTSWGDCWFVRPDNQTRSVTVSCFAIGRWK